MEELLGFIEPGGIQIKRKEISNETAGSYSLST